MENIDIIKRIINNENINEENESLLEIEMLKDIKKILPKEDFFNLIKESFFEIKYKNIIFLKEDMKEKFENYEQNKILNEIYRAL